MAIIHGTILLSKLLSVFKLYVFTWTIFVQNQKSISEKKKIDIWQSSEYF